MNKRTNRIFSILLITVMMLGIIVVGMLPAAAEDNTYAGDTKITPDETWFNAEEEATAGKVWEIHNAEDLLEFAKWANCDEGDNQKTPNDFANQTVKLMADIDLNPNWSASEHGAKGTPPINVWPNSNCDYFAGTFDGNGHTISGLYVNKESNNMGMFVGAKGTATIKNLALINSYFEQKGSKDRVAAICPTVAKGGNVTIENVYVDAIVIGPKTAGGIVGLLMDSGSSATVTGCVFAGSVKSSAKYVGGIVANGGSLTVNISDCVNLGTISGSDEVAGIIGRNAQANMTLTRCVNLGKIIGTSTGCVADLVGKNKLETTVFVDCYWVDGAGNNKAHGNGAESGTPSEASTATLVTVDELSAIIKANASFADWAVYGEGEAYEVMLPKYFTSAECKFIDSANSKDVMKEGIALGRGVYCETFNVPHIAEEDDDDCTTAIGCSVCNAITTPAAEDHTPAEADDGDCKTPIACSVCSKNAVEAKDHTPEADDGNCLTAVECSACDQIAIAAKDAHTPEEDDGNCTTAIVCSVCGTETTAAKAEHTPEADDNDCATAVKCSDCNVITTPAKAHTAEADDGNCLTAVECSVCDKFAVAAKAEHTPEADDGNCTTAVVCSDCGTVTTAAKEAHTPEADDGDCTTAIECSDCGTVTTAAKEAHTPAADDGDCTTAIKCSACDKIAVAAKEAHTYGDDGKCTACDAVKPADVATDTAPAADDGAKSSNGWIVGVVVVVVVVLAIGVGAVMLVNKKKSSDE